MTDICKACGAEIREGDNKCEYCGTAVTKKANRFCRICGTPYNEGVRYCRKCGTLTGQSAAKSTSGYRSRTQQPQAQAVPVSVPSIRRKSPAAAIVASLLIFAVIIAAVTAGINRCGIETATGGSGLKKCIK